jgi:anti-sigma-K factor RskA
MDDAHSLVAPYALDALDREDERAFEEHLALCDRCRSDLSALREAAAVLAFAPDAPAPPEQLRERILAQARSERPNVVPLRPRRRLTLSFGAAAAAAAAAAIGLGVWAESLSRSLDRKDAVIEVLGDPSARTVELSGTTGSLVVTRDGKAALVTRLRAAPSGKTYEAWVIRDNRARPAGLFRGGGKSTLLLSHRVERGDVVAVTLERSGGVDSPSTKPLLQSRSA